MTHEFKHLKAKEVLSFSEILIGKQLSYTVMFEKVGKTFRYNVSWSDEKDSKEPKEQ